MRIIIEVKDKKEFDRNRSRLKKIRELLNQDLEVKYQNSVQKDVFDEIENLSWEMGAKNYRNREELHDR